MNTGMLVIKPGIHATTQDLGRNGYQHLGVTPGGAADGLSANWANRLLENDPTAAVLEITAGGLELEVQTQTMVAVTGGDLNLTLNGHPQIPWRSFWVRQGDRLKFGYPRHGFRAYLAVSGGFQVNTVLGSCATVLRDGMGGIHGDGERLQHHDFLPCIHLQKERVARQIPERYLPDFNEDLTVHVIPGYQQQLFAKESWQTFWDSEYEITPDSDSMGARLKGKAVKPPEMNLLSEAVCYGAIQVPGDGQPIILLQQRQTLGGYPKLGSILPLSGFELAQRAPGSVIRFRPIGLTEAQQQMRRYLRFFGL
ncbi:MULTISPECIES: biotin-dependent carboxyltransferase family protein [Gammaproteobacteria]|uniref:5-oxoprolinase subunit C family protein n=1 Tax=Gammaproteobacteria TaxID=1236 RepID=UPI000DD05C94|nr:MULTISPECIES: biotin-dependent carboxyltransferase family protein [Gammaproteobacteria]RTE87020.1 biotin-dependent carboxyltransferase [Aliidiomarina sp. B3213]TCZ93190.1 biotin-dependent carboxyltransferase [Lysobacter sp. N42]